MLKYLSQDTEFCSLFKGSQLLRMHWDSNLGPS